MERTLVSVPPEVVEAHLHSVEYDGHVNPRPIEVYKPGKIVHTTGGVEPRDITEALRAFADLLPREPKALVLKLDDGREITLRHDYFGLGPHGDSTRGDGRRVLCSL